MKTLMRLDTPDPLLTAAKVATIIARVLLIAGMIGLGIGFAISVMVLGMHLFAAPPPGAPAAPAWASAGVVLLRFAGLMMLGLVYDFFDRLAAVIDTVGAGDPFVAGNAERIRRMGALALTAQLLSLAIAFVAARTGAELAVPAARGIFGFWIGGVVLSLTLFVLARVFRRGTEMRDDLAGTV